MPDDLHKGLVDKFPREREQFMRICLNPERFIHMDHRYHPVVGMGREMSDAPRSFTAFEGWMALNMARAAIQYFPRDSALPQYLDIEDDRGFLINIADEHRWPALVARQWVSELHDCGLITDRLMVVILQRMGPTLYS
jgi:hypothetical protein